MLLENLYQEMILDHGKQPRNFGSLPDATGTQLGHNPLCGDQLMVYVVEKENVLQRIQFIGQGCAISIASASLMTEAVQGKTTEEILTLFHHFHHLVTTGEHPTATIGKLLVFGGVAAFPIRVKCATLAWHTLKAILEKRNQLVTTEE